MKSVMLFPLSSQVKAGDVISGAKRIKRSLFQPRKGRYGKRYFTIVLLFGLARPKTIMQQQLNANISKSVKLSVPVK